MAKSNHETLGQCSRRCVGAKYLPTKYTQVLRHYRKCFAPTGLCQFRVVRFSVFVLFFLFCFSQPAAAHTVAELTKTPVSFDQQPVTVVGEVANVVTRYGDKPYTTFELLDAEDQSLPVFVWGKPTVKQGEVCRVTGAFAIEKKLETHLLARGIEAEKVENSWPQSRAQRASSFAKRKRPDSTRHAGFIFHSRPTIEGPRSKVRPQERACGPASEGLAPEGLLMVAGGFNPRLSDQSRDETESQFLLTVVGESRQQRLARGDHCRFQPSGKAWQ